MDIFTNHKFLSQLFSKLRDVQLRVAILVLILHLEKLFYHRSLNRIAYVS